MFTLIIEDKHGGIADEYSFEEGEFYIGRSHTSDIILPSDNVSRRHARLYTVDGQCYIEDLSSSNGVFVNGRRIHEVFQIQRSAQIKVGDYYLHIESDVAEAHEEEKTWCQLTGRSASFAGQVFRVQRKSTLIGRGKDCTLTIIDPSVSRIHTKLSVERSGALTLEDLKSSNGTFVNDERIEVATLHHRDLVRFGNVEFLVEVPGQEGSSVRRPSADNERDSTRERGRPEEPVRPATTPSPAYEDDWAAPKRSKTWLIWLLSAGFVALIATLLLVAFKDEIFGVAGVAPQTESAPVTETTPPVGSAPTQPTARETAPAEAKDKARKAAELLAMLEAGKDHFRGRRWELALGRYQAVLELDPLNEEARRAVNQIKVMERHKQQLDEARRLRDGLKRGQAAKLLREIDDASVYRLEAQEELQKLLEAKPTLSLTAENLLRQRDCEGAIATLNELQLIDPKDPEVAARLGAVTGLVGTRKCK